MPRLIGAIPRKVANVQKVWGGEPAVVKGLIGTLLTILLAWLNSQTTTSDALLSVATVLIPLLTGAAIRPSVTPVVKNDLG